MRSRTGLRGDDETLTDAILRRFVVREWMPDYVQRVRTSGVITAIFSNQTDWLERLDRCLPLSDMFDHVFDSYRLGRSKRDPAAFD